MAEAKKKTPSKLDSIGATLAKAAQAAGRSQTARRMVPAGRVQAPRHDSPKGHAAPRKAS